MTGRWREQQSGLLSVTALLSLRAAKLRWDSGRSDSVLPPGSKLEGGVGRSAVGEEGRVGALKVYQFLIRNWGFWVFPKS